MKKRRSFNKSKLYYPTPQEKTGIYISSRYFKIILGLIFLAGLVYFIFFSTFFHLQNVFFQGEPTPELSAELDTLIGRNVLFLSQAKLQDDLTAKYSIYKDIEIYKGLPDSIKVILNTRSRVLFWQANDKFYSIDQDGYAYEELSTLPDQNKIPVLKDNKNLPVVLGQKIVAQSFIQFIQDISTNFSAKIQSKITSIEIEETTYNLNVKTEGGWKAIFDTTRNSSDELDDLSLVLAKYGPDIHEYVDLRIAGRAYYK